ncbi:MAG: hypothetical protein QOE65_1992 [Solirubrobacteraceae bacterium]|nr:hypothetical protein [Solirubrobacteraceae bacterium]
MSGVPYAASLVSNLFHLGVPAPEKVLRSLLVFAFLVVALRLGGKRELAQINVLDLAVLLLVSNALQNAMIGSDNSLLGGVLGASTLFVANYVFVRITYRSAWARRVLEGTPRVLVRDGRVDRRALGREAISVSEIRSVARDRGFDGLHDVALLVLETNGHMAVMGAHDAERWRSDHGVPQGKQPQEPSAGR